MSEKKSLLYVDDETINLRLFEINFRRSFNVISALSGYAGLEILKEKHDVSVVISDMKMPGMNGIEFIRKAREICPDAIFFILTGYDINEEIEAALNEKLINSYFRKPYDVEDIESSLRAAIQ